MRLRNRWLLPAATVAALLAVGVVAFALVSSSSSEQASPSPGATVTGDARPAGGDEPAADAAGLTPEQRWQAELTTLDDARAAAFQGADESALTLVYAADSSALAQDVENMRAMVAVGAHAVGLKSVILSLEVLEEGSEKVVLRVTSRQEPYSFLAADGTVLSESPGEPSQTRDFVLVTTPDGWRIAQVAPVVE